MRSESYLLNEAQRILDTAIGEWRPVALVSLFSGGYDSMIATHVLHRLNTHGLSIQAWAINTQLSADGWTDYVTDVANSQTWNFKIYDNKKGFAQFVESVRMLGCPRTRAMHTFVFQKLKERGFDAILKMNKTNIHDKVLFASGMRRAESQARQNAKEVDRIGTSNKIFCAPIVDWSDEECAVYRVEHDLPDNPFYSTVRGSGDCQCNWGDFITLGTLQKFSPQLASGNVAMLDKLSMELHGYGWDSRLAAQSAMFDVDEIDEAKLTSPFMCAGCSRSKIRPSTEAIEQVMIQRGLF